jgi:carboxypeptidase Q
LSNSLISRCSLLAAAFAVVPLATARAQHPAAGDPVIERIRAFGTTSVSLRMDSEELFDSIGPRLTGSPGMTSASDWLVATYKSLGIPARNEQYGTWRGWRRGYSHIDLVSPRVRSLEGTMLAYSPGTGGKNVTATTVILPRFNDSTEFVQWLPTARGKLVLVSAPLPTCRPRDSYTRNAIPASRARMDSLRAAVQREWDATNARGTGYSLARGTGELGLRLEQGGVAGVVTSSPSDGLGTHVVMETYDTRAPAIALSCEDYGLLFRLTNGNRRPALRMNLDAQHLGERPAFNTIGEIKGGARPDEYVVLSAHFDSWDGASGATDNGTATLMVLEAMRILKHVLPHPSRTILAGHWSGEENGEVGSRAFAEDHPEVLKGLQALFNQDNGTGRISDMEAQGLPNSAEHLRAWLARLPADLPTFRLGGLPWDYWEYTWHSNRDTPDKIVLEDLESNAKLVAMLAYLASEDPATITRERITTTTWPDCGKAPRTTAPRLK